MATSKKTEGTTTPETPKAKVKAKAKNAEPKPEVAVDWGFEFDPSACEACGGRCCKNEYDRDDEWVNPLTGEKGGIIYKAIPLLEDEYNKILAYCEEHGIKHETLLRREVEVRGDKRVTHTIVHGLRPGMIGRDDCEFLIGGKCAIHDVKPTACQVFPFVGFVKKNLERHMNECPGIKLKS